MARAKKNSPGDLARQCRRDLLSLLERLSKLESLETASGAPRVADVVEHALDVLYAEYPTTALDHLIENHRWEHPAEALGRLRPTSRELLDAYRERTAGQRIARNSRLGQVGKRLKRAAEIAEAARKRRDRNRELDWIIGSESDKK